MKLKYRDKDGDLVTILERTEMSELLEFALSLHLQVKKKKLKQIQTIIKHHIIQVPPKKPTTETTKTRSKHLVDLATLRD